MEEPNRSHVYPEVGAQPRYPEMEDAVLDFWERESIFTASIENRAGAKDLVVYDGPPFANGLPHYGHLLTGFVKDAIPRYKTMRGYRVERRFGWDTHGLPAETEAEKELGVSGRQRITDFGIARFNDYCRTSVLRYTEEWRHYVTRQGRWVDFDDDYKTLDATYMESVLWAFKTLHDRGLVYEGYKVLPYCWECETPLSNFETRQDDATRERVDPAVTVAFELLPAEPGGTAEPGSTAEPGGTAEPGSTAPGGARDRGAGGEEAGGEATRNSAAGWLDGPVKVLVWTTTPWTLPSNLALAIGPDLDYAVLRRPTAAGGSGAADTLLVGAARVDAYAEELEGAELVGTVKGAALLGRRYRPLLPYFAETPDAFRVLAGEFVATDEGTGVVHMAPGFGEDDQRTCEANGIAVVCPVDDQGRFDARVPDYAGLQVFEANERIIERLARLGALVRREEYAHSYPHCWRTDTPLIYRAVSSYFVEVTAVKDRMVALNEEIDWIPAHVRHGAFGRWIAGARDWAISRNRFWGTPVPVWKSDDPAYPRVDVYGSLDQLERDFGVRPSDLHRPAVDELTRPNPDDPTGRATMRRVTDVLDCWFDSGSMPFAQLHYPFENAERFEANFPADFICEYMGQTRGWFYTLHVLATALFDRPAFSHCVAHGIVLGDDGRKLSKRLRNYPDPDEVFAREGADAMRWYLCSSAVLRGLDVAVAEKAMSEPIRQVLNPIWNSWYFLSLYGRSDGITGTFRTDQAGVLDRYVLAKARVLVEQVTTALDAYDLPGATSVVTEYLDALTNWYVRRSRDRFWRSAASGGGAGAGGVAGGGAGGVAGDGAGAADEDKRDAYDTLHTALSVLCRVAAPLLPFLTETVYRGLTGERSVHLADWPEPGELPDDPTLVERMDLVRAVCSAGHSIRKAQGLRSRLPLARLTFAAPGVRARGLSGLIADEVNVREVVLVEETAGHATTVLTVVPAALGPRLGPRTQAVIAAVRKGEWTEEVGPDGTSPDGTSPDGTSPDGTSPDGTSRVIAAGEVLEPGEYTLRLRPLDEDAGRCLPGDAGVVVLELALTPELEAEGAARDLVRIVQQARKDAGLHVSDRIELRLGLAADALALLLSRWDDGPGAASDGSAGSDGAATGDGTGPRWQSRPRHRRSP